jgi:nickel-dependent lactate racemase
MKVILKYGTAGLPIEFPESSGFVGILEPSESEPLIDPRRSAARSLQEPICSPPLAQLARGKKSACIVVSDITRPVPNQLLLLPILETLVGAGIPRSKILILIATGMHRPATEDEIVNLVGMETAQSFRIMNHFAQRRDDMFEVGKVADKIPVLVNRHYVNAELKILTGFIEPHLWAGYSGGRKSILPGISAIETLKHMHSPEMVAHPKCKYGELSGNPFHEAGLEVMAMAGADFIVNVTLNTRKEVTGLFSGHPVTAHLQGCEFLSRHCLCELASPLDFIVTTNSGAPLDCNLYQTVKGISGAAPVVKPRGDILIASRCQEGAGNPEYREILEMIDSPQMFLGRLMRKEFFFPDQWCAQEMCQIIMEHEVWLYTEGLTPAEVQRYHLHPTDDIEQSIRDQLKKHGPKAYWAIIPDGPMAITKLLTSTG